MKRIMYVLQNEDGSFYWKSDSISSMHGLNKDFKNAYLFKTKKGAEQRKKLPCYSKCTIKEVELKLVEERTINSLKKLIDNNKEEAVKYIKELNLI